MSQSLLAIVLSVAITSVSGCGRFSGEKTIHVLSTGDTHGAWFDSSYTGGKIRSNLYSVNKVVDSIRREVGGKNLVLLDLGDCLQGDNATYYYNFVETRGLHPLVRIFDYMGYDAVVVGNHDIEAGHGVYDRVRRQFNSKGISFLAANALDKKRGGSYFDEYKLIRKDGLKILVIGFTNPAIGNWVAEEKYEGIAVEELLPFVQVEVDKLRKKTRPDVVIAAVHSGMGSGNGRQSGNQGLDLLENLEGVDLLMCGHDHLTAALDKDGMSLIDAGSRASNVGHTVMTFKLNRDKVEYKKIETSLIRVRKNDVDTVMSKAFHPEFEAVREFTMKKIGSLQMPIRTRDSYYGMSDYVNLIHTVQLQYSDAQISFAAPLTYDAVIREGDLCLNDMFTIYPFENELFKIELRGREIKDYLEYSYNLWIHTYDGAHVLNILPKPDERTGATKWSFAGASYNFDSAAGLVYSVDITEKNGNRVKILSLADGSAFDMDATYTVALTSYRCHGRHWDDKVVAVYPEIREFVQRFVEESGELTPELINDYLLLGHWSFMPQPVASRALASDMDLLF